MNISGYLEHWKQTLIHKFWVAYNMARLYPAIRGLVPWKEWLWRALKHDWSKFTLSESKGFASTIFTLRHTEYGSSEYKRLLAKIKPSVDLHYKRNDHHPQHWPNEWDDMPAIARYELICDWAAAVRRHDGRNTIFNSIEMNQPRFGYSDTDKKILTTLAWQLVGQGPGHHPTRF